MGRFFCSIFFALALGLGSLKKGLGQEVFVERPATRRAVLASVEDDLKVELVPELLWEELFGVPLGLFHAFA